MVAQSQKKFEDIKTEVRAIFSSEKYQEITRSTNYKLSGVYMIYIDCNNDNLILPIYIGQSKNIQKRYKDHLTQLLSLNRLSYESYKEYFFSRKHSFYDGFFKTCKIFKYMIENNCDLTKFRMKILTECEVEDLDYHEEFYIKKFLSSFLGFNQFESLLQFNKLNWSKINDKENKENKEIEMSRFLNAIESDIEGVQKYYNYGFTQFNFEHSMPQDISFANSEINDNKTIKKIDQLQKELINLHENKMPEYFKMMKLKDRSNSFFKTKREVSKEEEDFTILLISKIKDLLNTDLLEQSDSLPLSRFLMKYEQGKINTLDFFKHSFTKGLLKEHYNEDVNKLIQVKADSKKADNDYFVEYKKRMEHLEKLRKRRYKLIFPVKNYETFPLKSLTVDHFPNNLRRTQVHVHFDLTNNGVMRSEIPKYTDLIRIVSLNIQNKKQSIYYIDNETTNKILSGISYVERDFDNMMVFKKQPFSLSSRTNNQSGPTLGLENYDNSFISVSSEYKHGINDYVIKDKNLMGIFDVFDHIYNSLSDKTIINFSCSESKNCLKKALINCGIKEHPLLDRLKIII